MSRGPVVAGRGSRVDGRGSRVDSRRSMVDGRWSRVVDRGLRVTGRGSVARAPHYRRAERLLRGRSGGVVRLPCRQRHSDHHRFRCVVPCRSARIVEIGGSTVRVNWKTTQSVARSLAHEQGAFRACERCNFFVRARRDLLRARLDLLRANVKSGTAFRFLGATLHRAGRLLHRRSVSSVSLAGQWSRAGRGSTVANGLVNSCCSQFAGHALRFRRSGATLSSRGTSVTRTFGRCGTSSMSPAAFRPTPFPMRGPMSIGTDCPR